MIRHLLFLIWNKKRAHTLLITEIWASFLVLFGISSLIIYNVSHYTEPIGFAYENVWSISLNNNQDTVAVAQKVQSIQQRLKSYPAIVSVSRMGDNVPFSNYHNSMGIAYGNIKTQVASYNTDENFARTLDIPVVAGVWYRAADSVATYRPVIINQKAVEAMFGADNPVGKVINDGDGKTPRWRVAGVINTFKAAGEFMKNEPAMFELLNDNDGSFKTLIIRVKSGTDAVFESKLVRDITAMTPGWSVDVNYLTDARKTKHNITLVPIIIFLIVSGFLLINVALGLFGVLNVSIARRRGEIGLRRALGATEGAITGQFVGEMWVLATFALVLGLLLAGQFPLMNVFDLDAGVYLMAMGVSVLIIYLLVTLCSVFPSRQAATVQPAVALHEE